MRIIVDANESRCGLAELLAAQWDDVAVRRLAVGDVAVGERILVERKTTDDFLASLNDGRLFRQARRLVASSPCPVFVQEGDTNDLTERLNRGAYWGVLLALSVGFRIPVLSTDNVEHTAAVVRHMAAQESRRTSRQRRRKARGEPSRDKASSNRNESLPPEALDVLLALPQVGPTRAAALAARLNSLRDLSNLNIRDLMGINGIGPDTAARIVDTIHGRVPSVPRER